jgi:hypothetical protein
MVLALEPGAGFGTWAGAALFGVCTVLFSHSTVSVDLDAIGLQLGTGRPWQTFPLADLEGVSVLKSDCAEYARAPYVAIPFLGFFCKDEVELVMRHGQRYRIRTDEPEKLEAAVREALRLRASAPRQSRPEEYRHTQNAWAFLALAPALLVVAVLVSPSSSILQTLGTFVAVTTHFSFVTVAVDAHGVRAWYGLGWPRRRFPVADLVGVSVIERAFPAQIRSPAFGFGGAEVVEIELSDGSRHALATDEPWALAAAIKRAIENGPRRNPPPARPPGHPYRGAA